MTIICLFLSVLALSDIYKSVEPNLDMEWTVIRISFLVASTFVIITSMTLIKLKKHITV